MTTPMVKQPSLRHSKHRYTDKYFAIPAIIFVAITTQIPFIATIVLSLTKWNLVRPDLGIGFNGLSNYSYFFWENARSSPEFWMIVLQTLQMTLISLVACTVFDSGRIALLDHDIPFINVAPDAGPGAVFRHVNHNRRDLESDHPEYDLWMVCQNCNSPGLACSGFFK